MSAKEIVSVLLEDDGHSEHVKGWERVQKWNNAHASYQHLAALQRKKAALERQLGQGIAIERALAHYGLQRTEVAEWITGDRVGQTDNYKRDVPAKACRNSKCNRKGVPVKGHREDCE